MHASTNPEQTSHVPWNKGKLIGQKPPLKLAEIWTVRTRLQMAGNTRDLALFNLALDSKLRGGDLVSVRVRDIAHQDRVVTRASVVQRKTHEPVRFELDTALVIAASGIDVPYAVLHPDAHARYASIGGAMNPSQPTSSAALSSGCGSGTASSLPPTTTRVATPSPPSDRSHRSRSRPGRPGRDLPPVPRGRTGLKRCPARPPRSGLHRPRSRLIRRHRPSPRLFRALSRFVS